MKPSAHSGEPSAAFELAPLEILPFLSLFVELSKLYIFFLNGSLDCPNFISDKIDRYWDCSTNSFFFSIYSSPLGSGKIHVVPGLEIEASRIKNGVKEGSSG